jgi:arylsulfatase
MLGSRSIVHDGWKATTDHVGAQISVERELVPGSHDFAEDRWSLFRMEDDFSEAHDVAEDHPEVVERLTAQWWLEAGRNQVLPLDDGFITRAIALEPNPWGPKASAVFRPGGGAVNEDQLPPMGGGFRLIADLVVPDGGADGVIAALGDWSNGFVLLVDDGCPTFAVNLFGQPTFVVGTEPLTAGEHTTTVEFRRERSTGGPIELRVDGAPVAETRLPADLPFRWQIGGGGLLIGRDHGFPVYEGYRPPFPFGGEIRTVTLEAPMLLPPRPVEEVQAALHRE